MGEIVCCNMFLYCLDSILYSDKTVCTSGGLVEGLATTTTRGTPYLAFTSVPYAQPPLGRLRFSKPESKAKWRGILKTQERIPSCVQYDIFIPGALNNTFGTEDCLYLNVYTPKTKGKLAVMVYIHGGSFTSGSADECNADYFLNQNIVLVCINYRLGPLGFLSFEDEDLPGNLGLYDQKLALEWVQQNIQGFGGDPRKVTIFGESAGGLCVYLHMQSPLSRGLYAQAISQSGPLGEVAYQGETKKTAVRWASTLGCLKHSTSATLDCLRTRSAYVLTGAARSLYEWNKQPVAFGPVVEGGGNGFLRMDPFRVRTPAIPWLTGAVSGEGLIFTAIMSGSGHQYLRDLNEDFDQLCPLILDYQHTASNPSAVTTKIREFYFGKNNISFSTYQNLSNMYADGLFYYPLHEALRRHNGDAYLYFFDYLGAGSYTELMGGRRILDAACHGDDLIYIFNQDEYFPILKGRDRQVSKIMVNIWTQFAKTGKPVDNNWLVEWESWGEDGDYVEINSGGLSSKKSLFSSPLLRNRIEFWKRLPYRDKFN